jgi:hypothetical protein
LVDSPNSLGGKARARRWGTFTELFPGISEMRVLDLGGTVESWRRAPVRPAHVTLINQRDIDTPLPGEPITAVTGDACQASDALRNSNVDREFDLVFSNSLIEHVGGHSKRMELAEQIRKLAPRHWVQTPYRYFPLEPHWLFPGMQFMPAAAQTQVALYWPLAGKPPNKEAARRAVLWTELLSVTDMEEYFPDSTVVREKALGLTKSLIAVRQS